MSFSNEDIKDLDTLFDALLTQMDNTRVRAATFAYLADNDTVCQVTFQWLGGPVDFEGELSDPESDDTE